jgi:hypothetical protein
VSPQAAGLLQQLPPAQPLAGGLHGLPRHWVTLSAQTPVKQLLEQHSLSWVQVPPLALPQLWFAQQIVPAGQLLALHWH